MKYLRFQVRLEAEGWYVQSDKLSVEDQLRPFPTKRAAITAARELEAEAWCQTLPWGSP